MAIVACLELGNGEGGKRDANTQTWNLWMDDFILEIKHLLLNIFVFANIVLDQLSQIRIVINNC